MNIIAVYSLPLSIIIFKIITKNVKISLKLPILGSNPTAGCPIHLKIYGQIDVDLMNKLPHVRFALNALVSEIEAKNCILPLCSIFSHGGHLGWLAGSQDRYLDTPMMIVAKFG